MYVLMNFKESRFFSLVMFKLYFFYLQLCLFFFLLIIRSNLHRDLMTLREDQLFMTQDLSTHQLRWNSVREEKIKVANLLSNAKRAEEELNRLAEEKHQVDLELKVNSFLKSVFFIMSS